MASIRELDQAINSCSQRVLAVLCKRLIRTSTQASDFAHEILMPGRISTQVAAASSSAARKRKHEEVVEVVRIEICTVCNDAFETNKIETDKCHYHPGKALRDL